MFQKFLVTASLCLAANFAHAQEYPECRDVFQTPVQILDANDENYSFQRVQYAGARYLNFDTEGYNLPAIILDYDYLRRATELQRAFTYAHECYHLSSGDAYHAYHHSITLGLAGQPHTETDIELDADCDAAQYLARHNEPGQIYEDLLPFIEAVTSRRRLDERLSNLRACLG